MPDKMYLKEGEVAEISSISKRTLQNDRYYKRGIPYIKKNSSVFYRRSDVLEFMESNKIKTGEK